MSPCSVNKGSDRPFYIQLC